MVEFVGIFVYFFIALALAGILLGVAFIFATKKADPEKISAYECGFDPYEDARNVFDVRFYLVAILFLIFDLEAAFFFPWCVSLSFLNIDALWGMLEFVIELLFGLYYAWQVGALDWE